MIFPGVMGFHILFCFVISSLVRTWKHKLRSRKVVKMHDTNHSNSLIGPQPFNAEDSVIAPWRFIHWMEVCFCEQKNLQRIWQGQQTVTKMFCALSRSPVKIKWERGQQRGIQKDAILRINSWKIIHFWANVFSWQSQITTYAYILIAKPLTLKISLFLSEISLIDLDF